MFCILFLILVSYTTQIEMTLLKKIFPFLDTTKKNQRQVEHFALFQQVRAIITNNYAGWFDKTDGAYAKLQLLTAKIKGRIKKAKNIEEAYSIIDDWVNFFEDPHLKIYKYKNHDAPNPPTSLHFFQQDCAVFTIPSCWDDDRRKLRALLTSPQLKEVPYWIIDLRDNRGGFQGTMDLFLPYLQTQSIKYWHGKARVTRRNAEAWISTYLVDIINSMSYHRRARFSKKFQTFLKKRQGTFHQWLKPSNEAYTMLSFYFTKEFPKKIVVLVNQETCSAGEIFLLSAEQSDKVTIMGTNTNGMMDYGFVVNYALPDENRVLRIPMVRHSWLDEGLSYDNIGYPPQIFLDPDASNWEDIAYQYMKEYN